MNLGLSSRRGVLGGAVAAVVASQLPASVARAAPDPPRPRRNVETLSAAELAAYEHAIQITKTRSAANPDDPTGYDYFAGLHDNADQSIHSGCTHFSEKFFPWHRQYLADFEAVLQQTDPPVTKDVMIPYWDWSKPPMAGVHFPQAFERADSPLFDSTRLKLTPPPWDPADVMSMVQDGDWALFGGKPDPSDGFGQSPGSVENGPHNTLHTRISRDMKNPSTAVRDPIFWSFHAYIDLVWARWQRLHVPANQAQVFADGSAILWYRTRQVAVSKTARITDLKYVYEYDYTPDGPAMPAAPAPAPLPPGSPPPPPRGVAAPPKSVLAFKSLPGKGGDLRLAARPPAAPAADTVLRLDGIRVFDDRSYTINVYLHPPGAVMAKLAPAARRKYLMRIVGVWRAHHPTTIEVFIRPTAAQLAHLAEGWVVTLRSEAAPGEEGPYPAPAPAAHAHAAAPAPVPATGVPPAKALVKSLELQRR